MFEAIRNTWNETMEIPEARWIVWFTILLIAIIIAVYVAKIFRDMAVGENVTTGDLFSDFDRLRNEGKLERRRISETEIDDS